MLEPILKTIEVPCEQEQAFKIFIEEVTTWWPLDKNSVSAMSGEVAKAVVIEAKLNGKVYEVGHDDTQHRWGTVTHYDPFNGFAMDWHIGRPAAEASKVVVNFIAMEKKLTRVELSHSNWEVFGDKAADMRAGYDSGWVGVFEQAYLAACSVST